MRVKVGFDYIPDEPDEDNPTGMSEDEYVSLCEKLLALGADDIQVNVVTADE